MPILAKDFPPFSMLTALEAVDRTGSFAAAARDLRVSQPAISQKIAQLEVWLGLSLFERTGTRVVPTGMARSLATATRNGVQTILTEIAEIKRRQSLRPSITIAATNAFTHFWLSPRIHSLYERLGDTDVNFQTSDHDIGEYSGGFDIGVVFSSQNLPGYNVVDLFEDKVFPVASQAYCASRPGGAEAAVGDHDRLLGLENQVADWLDWSILVNLTQSQRAVAARHTSYMTLLQACRNGRGVLMGWQSLVHDMLLSGDLLKIGAHEFSPRRQHKLLIPDRIDLSVSTNINIAKNWLQEEARAYTQS